MTPSPSGASGPQAAQAIVTAVYGRHAEQLDHTFTSFLRNPACALHAFVVGDRLPRRQLAGVTYHLRPPDPAFGHPLRDVDFRRWEFLDDLAADLALVVDGMDVLCLRELAPFSELLKGGWVAGAVEHAGGRYLGGGLYTSNFLNAGVTLWDIRASRPLRQAILERGRRRFRNLVDDQLALNEWVHTRYFDRLTLLPCQYNYRGSLGRKPFGWPRCRGLDGVRIYHNRHWIHLAKQHPGQATAEPEPLPPDRAPPGIWQQRLRRVWQRWRRTGYPPVWPQC